LPEPQSRTAAPKRDVGIVGQPVAHVRPIEFGFFLPERVLWCGAGHPFCFVIFGGTESTVAGGTGTLRVI
jgi:hypothetical protein